MTSVQIYFRVYILRHHPNGTYFTELCHEIGVSKATLSALIKKYTVKTVKKTDRRYIYCEKSIAAA